MRWVLIWNRGSIDRNRHYSGMNHEIHENEKALIRAFLFFVVWVLYAGGIENPREIDRYFRLVG